MAGMWSKAPPKKAAPAPIVDSKMDNSEEVCAPFSLLSTHLAAYASAKHTANSDNLLWPLDWVKCNSFFSPCTTNIPLILLVMFLVRYVDVMHNFDD